MNKTFIVTLEYRPDTKTIAILAEGSNPVVTLDLRELGWNDEELERRIGYIVVAALSTASGASVGHRDYRKDRNDIAPFVLKHFKEKLHAGDQSAVITLVNELMASAARNLDEAEVARAEQLLRDAARSGNQLAIQYLENGWPRDKNDLIDSIRSRGAP